MIAFYLDVVLLDVTAARVLLQHSAYSMISEHDDTAAFA